MSVRSEEEQQRKAQEEARRLVTEGAAQKLLLVLVMSTPQTLAQRQAIRDSRDGASASFAETKTLLDELFAKARSHQPDAPRAVAVLGGGDALAEA